MAQQQPTLQALKNDKLQDLQPVLQSTPLGPPSSFIKTAPAKPVEFVQDGRTFDVSNGYPVFAQGSGMPWAQDKMGVSGDKLSGYGCAITAVAMGVSGITGQTVTPGEMNTFMNGIDGYNGNGAIDRWDQMGKVAGSDVQVKREEWGTFKADQIDQELAQGRPVVVQVDYKRDTQGDHWILVTGKTADGTYMANDPAGGRAITMHRNADGQLVSDAPPPGYDRPYVTTGNATTFDRGAPAGQAGTTTPQVKEAPIPMPPLDRSKSQQAPIPMPPLDRSKSQQ
ncbi:C39 family peptidase, partial [Hyalangium sp.]|uniref:C39 family peptidase n=1 Tax=Hyalangium sp. TaxID=2028555 RepID=UPI002D29BC27